MKSIKQRIQFIQEGGLVQRFHTRPGIKPDTDAAHQWMVAMLCYLLSPTMPSPDLLMQALCHDLAEQRSGDVPAPTKWALHMTALDTLEADTLFKYGLGFVVDEAEARILALADALGGMLYCASEAALGNRNATLMYGKWLSRVRSTPELTAREQEVINAVDSIWEESNGQTGPQFNVFAD